MKFDNLFSNIEKIFRYLVPAFALTLFLQNYEPSFYEKHLLNISDFKFTLYLLVAGIVIYAIHRIVFEIFDFMINCFINYVCITQNRYKKSISELIAGSFKLDENLRNFFYYKMAIIHSLLIITEIIIIFAYIYDIKMYRLPNSALTSFLVFFIIYCAYYYIQKKEITQKLLNSKPTQKTTEQAS